MMTQNLITPEMHDGELRIIDTDLAVRLGFAKPAKIRDLIKRHKATLEKIGTLPTVGRVINGGNATEYYLNRKQAIFITAKSETATATDITIEIIERFDAYERGEAQPSIPQTYAAALLEAGRLAAEKDQIEAARAAAQARVEELEPKAEAHDHLAEQDGELGVRDAGRELRVGQKWVTDYIDGHAWSCVEGGKRKPAHYGLKMGYCRLIPEDYRHPHTGEEKVREAFRLTRKGIGRLAEIIVEMRKKNGLPTVPFVPAPEPAS